MTQTPGWAPVVLTHDGPEEQSISLSQCAVMGVGKGNDWHQGACERLQTGASGRATGNLLGRCGGAWGGSGQRIQETEAYSMTNRQVNLSISVSYLYSKKHLESMSRQVLKGKNRCYTRRITVHLVRQWTRTTCAKWAQAAYFFPCVPVCECVCVRQ